MAKRHLLCKTCSNYLVSWGKTKSGKQRYRCLTCGKTRNYHKQRRRKENIFQLFKQYVLWGNTYEMLSSLSGYSIRFLEEKFHKYFQEEPSSLPSDAALVRSSGCLKNAVVYSFGTDTFWFSIATSLILLSCSLVARASLFNIPNACMCSAIVFVAPAAFWCISSSNSGLASNIICAKTGGV